METFYRSIPEFIVKTDDITKLTNRACDNLKLGDEVILLDGDEQIKYNVISKSVDGMKLANITGEAVTEVIYSKEGNVWSYVETKSVELGGDTSLKTGDYIYNEENNKFEWIEEIPEDFTGQNLYIDSGEIGQYLYTNGEIISGVSFNNGGLIVEDEGVIASFSSLGANKLNFEQLTHSFNELDPTLKQIVDDAIEDNGQNGVACTQAQWNTIKLLLDNSLYLNYDGYSMIRCIADGIHFYAFGELGGHMAGQHLELNFDAPNNLLYCYLSQV